MVKPKLSLNPATIGRCDFEQSVKIARQANYEGIGLRHNQLIDFIGKGRSSDQALEIINRYGLTTTEAGFLSGWMFHGGVPLTGKRERSGETRDQLLKEMNDFFVLVSKLGTPPVTALVATEESGSLKDAVNDLTWLCDRAGEHGLQVMLELVGTAPQINSVRNAWQLLEMTERDNCGLLLDAFLMYMGEFDLEKIANIPGEKIFTVHISDAPAEKDRKDLNMLQDRIFPGEGIIPLVEFFSAVQSTGYNGWYTVEIFNPEYNQMEPLEVASRALAGMKKFIS